MNHFLTKPPGKRTSPIFVDSVATQLNCIGPRLLPLLLSLLLLAGCRSQTVDATYGKQRGAAGGGSVNGTAVLADMFRDHGCRVLTGTRLSPKIERADVIVWFPDDFDPPTADQRDYLESWLYEGGKTLIYVGRDYNAAPLYWERVAAGAPPDQLEELWRRQATARSRHDSQRTELDDKFDAEWFTVDTGTALRKVNSLAGPWSRGIDAKAADIYVQANLVPPKPITAGGTSTWVSPPESEVLLASEGTPLVYRLTSDDYFQSEILVVANGSMVFNLPLVNKENRKLAGKLIDAALPAKEVVFLESGKGGPMVFDHEPTGKLRTGWEAFTIYPLGLILMHLAVAGTLYCFARYSIFGRPRVIPVTRLSDFGHHIAALGKLLEHTGDAEYARSRLRHYNQTARRDSGASHSKPKKTKYDEQQT